MAFPQVLRRQPRSAREPTAVPHESSLPLNASNSKQQPRRAPFSGQSRVFFGAVVILVANAMGGIHLVVVLLFLFLLFLLILKRRSLPQQRDAVKKKQSRQLHWLLLVLSCLAAFVGLSKLAIALGYQPPKLVYNKTPNTNNHEMLTVFLIDGLRADVFQEELQAGHLPNMQRLASNGCRVTRTIAPFPTITGYAYWPLLTGTEATRSNHLGTRYFDRRLDSGNWHNYYGPANKLFNPDFEVSVQTLFEANTASWSLSTNSFLSRGASLIWNTGTEQAFSKALHIWWLPQLLRKIPIVGKVLAPTFAEHEVFYIQRIIRLVNTKPKPSLVWVVFSGADNVAHALGVNQVYRDVLQAIDQAIGTYVDQVDSTDKHTFAIVSDHGEASVDIASGGNLDLCDAFAPIGLRAWRGDSKNWSGKFDEPLKQFGADKDVLIGISGDMSATVYVKAPNGNWKERTFESDLMQYQQNSNEKSVNIVDTVLQYKGVQLVAWSRQNGVVAVQTTTMNHDKTRVINRAVGVITLDETDGMISYRVERNSQDDNCPLGYDKRLADGTKRSARTWLQETADSPFPYALVRLIQYFTVPGLAPDMVVTAHDGFDFGKDWEYYVGNFAGGHGGIHKDHMVVPAIFSGHGVVGQGGGVTAANAVIQTATVEDVGASLHYLLSKQTKTTELKPPSLDFLQDHHDDVIAQAYNSNKKSAPDQENAAEDLLRGKPLSCLV